MREARGVRPSPGSPRTVIRGSPPSPAVRERALFLRPRPPKGESGRGEGGCSGTPARRNFRIRTLDARPARQLSADPSGGADLCRPVRRRGALFLPAQLLAGAAL